MTRFNKLIAFAALAVMLPSAASAVTVTITSNNLVARANDNSGGYVDDIFNGTAIPTNTSISATDGANTSTVDIDYSVSGGQTTLSHDMTQTRDGTVGSHAQSFDNSLSFTVDVDTQYQISGNYSVTDTDNSDAGTVYFYSYLRDNTAGSTLLSSYQQSRSTTDESFTFGLQQGDDSNSLSGSLTGLLFAGHSYRWISQALTHAYPDADSGASALGNFTLAIGTGAPSEVPIPPALSLFGSGLAVLGFVGWRRKRKAESSAM
ncbi:MAG: hypothetical protein GY942_04685 [Aestuariibacter sp.]|nr:hypothetical protein [Aestuariibacter sp.]